MKTRLLSLAFASLICAAGAFAQGYKTQTVKIVVPTGAGTIADIVTRVMAQDLAKQLDQTFIVEDKAGANGIIGAQSVATAPPDGTTFIVGNVSTHAANEFLFKSLPYDPEKDFTPVALVGFVPHVLVVSESLPVKTYADFVKLAKEKPGKLNFASGSSLTQVAMEVIKHGAGIETLYVPFKSTPQAMTEMLAGRIDVMVADFGVAKPLIDSGKIRPLLVASSSRSPLLPNIPAFPEVGLPKIDIIGWFGWFAPKGTPKEAVNRVYEGLKKASANKDYQEKLASYGVSLTGQSPEQLEKFRAEQRSMYQRLVKEAGIAPQ
jgi:tripartite-type tricarboxylate transporter receptor subunit TctC